jgi:hypothetical protein
MGQLPIDADRSSSPRAILGPRLRELAAWVLSIGGGCWVVAQRQQFPSWLLMWLLAGMVFAGLKLLSWLHLQDPFALTGSRLAGYFFLWPGMRPQPFMPGPPRFASLRQNLAARGMANLLVGLLLLGLALLVKAPWWLPAWLAMAGFSFVVHFGVFDLLAAAWRRAGVPVEKLFVCPVAARSLADFWGNRWNRAFSAFARDLLFVPAARHVGAAGATLIVFGFSGVIHELVISLPAGGGYGGPLLYFLIQGLLLLAENSPVLRARLRHRSQYARLWTAAAVLGPMPFLFHPPFLHRVVLPFVAALGG